MPPIAEYIWMVGNGAPITGCLVHRVTKYNWFHDSTYVGFDRAMKMSLFSMCMMDNGY